MFKRDPAALHWSLAQIIVLAVISAALVAMKAHYRIDAGDLRVIRPLVYVRETQTAAFAASADLPVVPDSCPACFTAPTQRAYMKTLLAREEREHDHLFANLLHAMRPLMGGDVALDDNRPSQRAAAES